MLFLDYAKINLFIDFSKKRKTFPMCFFKIIY